MTTPLNWKCSETFVVLDSKKLTRSVSSMSATIRRAHSAAGITSGYFLYSLSNVNAAFLRTKFSEVLQTALSLSHTVHVEKRAAPTAK